MDLYMILNTGILLKEEADYFAGMSPDAGEAF